MPGIALAQAWRRRSPSHHVLYLAGPRAFDGRTLNKTDIPWARGARHVFAYYRPDVVAVTGGRSSIGAAFEAARRGVPLFVLEQNVIPGRANRLMALAARTVFSQFAEARRWFRRPMLHTGSPMRELPRMEKAAARARLGLDPDAYTVLVLGGSLGARDLNDLGPRVAELVEAQWIHLYGHRRAPAYRARAFTANFSDDMATIYSAADAVLSRAGAIAILEVAAFGLPAILVPFPGAADDHQRANARVLATAGAAVCMDEPTPERVAWTLRSWDAASLSRNVSRFAFPDAAERIAREIEARSEGNTETRRARRARRPEPMTRRGDGAEERIARGMEAA